MMGTGIMFNKLTKVPLVNASNAYRNSLNNNQFKANCNKI